MSSTPPDPRYQSQYDAPTYAQDTVRESNGPAYAESHRQSYVDPAGNRVVNQVNVIEDANQRKANIRYWITRITYFILGVLEVILALRFIFRLLGANQGNAFITFLYDLSHVFVGPFNGIFNDQTIGNASVFETSTLIAMLVYALIAWGIVSLGRVLFASDIPDSQTITRRSRYS